MKNFPKYTRIATLSAAAVLMAAPALAQSTTPEQSNPPAAMEQPESAPAGETNAAGETKTDATAGATATLGEAVWSSDGEELGEVTKVNLDANGQVESIHFVVGSTLGIGGKTVMSEAADFSRNNDRIELKIDAEAAKALPEVTE